MKPMIKEALFCCFLGMFGVHKFRKKQIFAGVVYAMTLGLFGFGWVRDSIYSILSVTDYHNNTNPYNSDDPTAANVDSFLTPRSRKALTVIDLILNGLAATVVFILSCVTMPSVASILGFLALGLLLPIPAWQEWLDKFSGPDLRRIIATLLVITMLIIGSPAPDTDYTPAVSTTPTTTSVAPVTTSARVTTITTTATTTTTTATTITTTTATTVHIHDFAVATCESPKTCLTCGATEGNAVGHSFYEGSCSVCNKADPHYTAEKMVWIPNNGGTKYHSRRGCSNMIAPSEVTLSEAIARGFTPCGRCY